MDFPGISITPTLHYSDSSTSLRLPANEIRDQIVSYLGATKYSIGQTQIQAQSQGDNASLNQVMLRAPGVSQDSFGQLHVRDEHANLQFRIDDVLISERITGFGQEIDTRLVDNVNLITGSLPARGMKRMQSANTASSST
jgi:hypothetical protein